MVVITLPGIIIYNTQGQFSGKTGTNFSMFKNRNNNLSPASEGNTLMSLKNLIIGMSMSGYVKTKEFNERELMSGSEVGKKTFALISSESGKV